MATRSLDVWSGIEQSDWDGMQAPSSEEGEEGVPEGEPQGGPQGEPEGETQAAALAAVPQGGKVTDHGKFNFCVCNFGTARKQGEEAYARNAFEIPCFVGVILEVDTKQIEQWTTPCSTWAPASAELPIESPPQGFHGDGRQVKKWIATGVYVDIAVVGLATRVESLEKIKAETVHHGPNAKSRLLMVDVKWRTPIAKRHHIPVIGGHLHNTIAKKQAARSTASF